MTYHDYMRKVQEIAIALDEHSGLYYINPYYMHILRHDSQLSAKPKQITKEQIRQYLELQVDRLNKHFDKTKIVVDYIYDLITTKVQPTMIQEEIQLVNNAMQYLNTKNGTQNNKTSNAQQTKKKLPFINFSKKKTKNSQAI